MSDAPDANAAGVLNELFGVNRAEFLPADFSSLFVAPTYFRKLENERPSLLIGGRGTGKTTALRSLQFEATLKRLESIGQGFGEQNYLGIFIRINKNRVHAFAGAPLNQDEWDKAFAHYFNLLACKEMCDLASWLERLSEVKLSTGGLRRISADLAVGVADSVTGLRANIKSALSELQLFVNNPTSVPRPVCSIAESPLRAFTEVLTEDELIGGRMIFCCIDEYENLLPSQQAILNTYIKHAEPPLSYKVGLRSNGLHTRKTIDEKDQLNVPDDYNSVDIANEEFAGFAQAVVERRLARAKARGVIVESTLTTFLESMSLAEEAMELGAGAVAERVLNELGTDSSELRRAFELRPASDVYFLRVWSEFEKKTVAVLATDWLRHEHKWATRLANYRYASLFWLSVGAKGRRIRKYYCGANTLLALSGGNIRYFLELIAEAISQAQVGGVPAPKKLSPKAQTKAAVQVGLNRLNQLEGLAERGVQLKRLVLAIGKVFFELARQPIGKTPEVTSFVVTGTGDTRKQVDDLLREGVGYLAFEATPRTKATSASEVKDDEYRLHPIFCAFFEISHRRKRRLIFSAEDLLAAYEDPSKTIKRLLGGGLTTSDDDLPDQLALFHSFYGADS